VCACVFLFIYLSIGRAVAQPVSRWLPTAAARVRVRAACGICGGQSGTEAGFLRVLRFPLPIIPSISASSESPGADKIGLLVAAVPSGPNWTPPPNIPIKKNLSISLSVALQIFFGTWPLFQFLNLYTVGRTPWTGDRSVARPLPTHRTIQTQNKRTHTSMPRVVFEPMIPLLKRAKTVHTLDRAATVIGVLLI
jgi:hypothetical protein